MPMLPFSFSDDHHLLKLDGTAGKVIPTAIVTGTPSASLNTNAFTILSTDNLHTSYSKPNAIVRPIRRRDPSYDDDAAEPPNGDGSGGTAAAAEDRSSVYSKAVLEPNYELGKFTKELDLKLRRLTKDNKKPSSKNVINHSVVLSGKFCFFLFCVFHSTTANVCKSTI